MSVFDSDDTIVAIATPFGQGGIGVVRVSGPAAAEVGLAILDRGRPLEPRRATIARVVGENRDRIDEVVATFFAGPHSYTGEDVLEVSAHGSPVILRDIVRAAMRAGARLAEPGEFTLRAYLRGRLDLVQAEAVGDLVAAVTPIQARAAFDQLDGTLTGAIAKIDLQVFDLVARFETSLDFPEEGYHFVAAGEAEGALVEIAEAIDRLQAEARRGRLIREGRQVALLGKPNVGKSTLFNYLVGANRAIVTEIPGTTRDLVTEVADFEGIRLGFVDTAGFAESLDVIEQEGVARARLAMSAADVSLVILDRSNELEAIDERILGWTQGKPRLVVVNKTDRPACWPPARLGGVGPLVEVSLRTGEGLDGFRDAFMEVLGVSGGVPRDVPLVTNVRHQALLEQARASVQRALAGVRDAGTSFSEEFVLADLAAARQALESITGQRVAEDVLREIFSRFCVGK